MGCGASKTAAAKVAVDAPPSARAHSAAEAPAPDSDEADTKLEEEWLGDVAAEIKLSKMGRWTRSLVRVLVPTYFNHAGYGEEDLVEPLNYGEGQPLDIISVGDIQFVNLVNDPSAGNMTLKTRYALKAVSSQLLFPIQDRLEDVTDEACVHFLEKTKIDTIMPPGNVPIKDPTTDQAMTRIVFYGFGAHRVEAVDGYESPAPPAGAVFKVDLLLMNAFEVREDFEPYGAIIYFDEEQKPVAITTYDNQLVLPDAGAAWEHAKLAFKCSLVTFITQVDHLYNLHFACSAQMVRAMVECLPTTSPLRRGLHPFTFRTVRVNGEAGYSLLPEGSIVHHMTAFTYDAIKKIAIAAYKKYDRMGLPWRPLPDAYEALGPKIRALVEADKLPYMKDGLELFAVYRSYFEAVLAEEEHLCGSPLENADVLKFWAKLREYTDCPYMLQELSKDSLVDVCAQFAFSVSAYHEQVGSIVEYLRTPLHCGFRIRPNALRVDAQSWIIAACLISMTSIQTPALLSDFPTFFKDGPVKDAWIAMQAQLKALEASFDERDAGRPYSVPTCNPKILEVAVSV